MAINHPENFVAYHSDLASRGQAAVSLGEVERAMVSARTAADINNLAARRAVLEWHVLLEQGDELYRQAKYDQALSTYRLVAKKVLELIQPKLSLFGIPKQWAEGAVVAQALATASAELLNHLLPASPARALVSPASDPEFDPVRLKAKPASIVAAAMQPEAVHSLVQRAAAATEASRYEEAAGLYSEIIDRQPAPSVRAEALLNLGAVEIQRNRPQDAMRTLAQARAAFEQLGDLLGIAEATHNSALAELRAGRAAEARRLLDEAEAAAARADLAGLLIEPPKQNGAATPPRRVALAPGNLAPVIAAEPGRHVAVLDRGRITDGLGAAVLAPPVVIPPRDTGALAEAIGSTDLMLRLRPLDNTLGTVSIRMDTPAQERVDALGRTIVLDGGETLSWSTGKRLEAAALTKIFEQRTTAKELDRVGWLTGTVETTAGNLPYVYHFVLPIKIADCLHQLGDQQQAHEEYLRAARYPFLNRPLEAPDLWRRLAENVLAWGDKLYREGKADEALPVYGLLATDHGAAPGSILYTLDGLKPVGASVAAWLAAVAAQTQPPVLNPLLAQVMYSVLARWAYLNAGLDYFGQLANAISPFTFRYLQEVARYFAQRAIQTEQRFIEFYARFESGQMTRSELGNAAEQAQLGVDLAHQNEVGAEAGVRTANATVDLARLRHQNAVDQLDQFNDVAWELEALAGHIARGNAWTGGDQPNLHYSAEGAYDFEGKKHEVLQQLSSRQTQISNDLQRERMEDAVAELDAARAIANGQRDQATARRAAARIETRIAESRAQHAQDMLDAFNDQVFNPEQWLAMANLMKALSETALDRAIEVARVMEGAYNFENFDHRHAIRNAYRLGATQGMLGGEVLLSDIDSFTHYHLTHAPEKPIPVKWALSLAEDYPGAYLLFQRSGKMEFEVDLARLINAHPGTYRHRLVGAELEVDGFLPPTGLHGRLTCSGLGRYRDRDGQVRIRLQPAETAVLSRYSRRQDALLLTPPPEMRALFEGTSVASGWLLELPRISNDVELSLVFDVRLILYFDCLFDRDRFAADIVPAAAPATRQRALFLRQHFPDAYYQLRETGNATLALAARDFPLNQLNPEIAALALAVVPAPGASLEGVGLAVAYPGQPAANVTVSAQQMVPSSAFPVAASTSALGSYELRLAPGDAARKDDIDDLVLVLDYRHTAPAV